MKSHLCNTEDNLENQTQANFYAIISQLYLQCTGIRVKKLNEQNKPFYFSTVVKEKINT